MAALIFVHGLSNKPESDYLFNLWKRKLAFDEGLNLDSYDIACAMAYWADVLYPMPDTNLADYEAAQGGEALVETRPVAHSEFEGIAQDPKMRRLAIALGVDLTLRRWRSHYRKRCRT